MKDLAPATLPQPDTSNAALGSQPPTGEQSPLVAVPFTAAEREALHRDDRQAAMAVVGIMVAIFTLAVIAYTAISILVAGS